MHAKCNAPFFNQFKHFSVDIQSWLCTQYTYAMGQTLGMTAYDAMKLRDMYTFKGSYSFKSGPFSSKLNFELNAVNAVEHRYTMKTSSGWCYSQHTTLPSRGRAGQVKCDRAQIGSPPRHDEIFEIYPKGEGRYALRSFQHRGHFCQRVSPDIR